MGILYKGSRYWHFSKRTEVWVPSLDRAYAELVHEGGRSLPVRETGWDEYWNGVDFVKVPAGKIYDIWLGELIPDDQCPGVIQGREFSDFDDLGPSGEGIFANEDPPEGDPEGGGIFADEDPPQGDPEGAGGPPENPPASITPSGKGGRRKKKKKK